MAGELRQQHCCNMFLLALPSPYVLSRLDTPVSPIQICATSCATVKNLAAGVVTPLIKINGAYLSDMAKPQNSSADNVRWVNPPAYPAHNAKIPPSSTASIVFFHASSAVDALSAKAKPILRVARISFATSFVGVFIEAFPTNGSGFTPLDLNIPDTSFASIARCK